MNRRHQAEPVAVTGWGGCCAAGATVAETCAALKRGEVNCGPVLPELFHTTLAFPVFSRSGSLPDRRGLELTTDTYCPPEQLNRTILLTLDALSQALDDAGLSREDLRAGRVGIVLGTTVGCTFHDESYYAAWRRGKRPDPGPVHQYLATSPASFLQNILGTTGPTAVVTNACASGTDAVGIGSDWLRRNCCDLVIAGGADGLSRTAYYGFASLMLMAEIPCTPFNRNRPGLNLGEGAALLILEREDRAAERRARIRGRVRGWAAASDCHHPTAPHPRGRGLQAALNQAMAKAGVSGRDISFINAHGTGTPANDSAEMNALAGTGLSHCPVVSTKGATGHMLGAAGAMEAILTLQVLAEGESRGTIGCVEPDQDLALAPLPQDEQVRLTGRLGISQSLAFGGTNSVLVLEGEAS